MKNYKYLTSNKLKQRLLYICNKFGRGDLFEDIYHDYVIHILEGYGQHQTLDQFFLDYSRKKKWVTSNGRSKVIHMCEIQENEITPTVDTCPFLYEYLDKLKGTERALAVCHYKYNIRLRELADIFGADPSRISQIMKMTRDKLKNAILE